MEYHNVHSTLRNGERVSSTYAELYFNDNNSKPETRKDSKIPKLPISFEGDDKVDDGKEWISPSDLLIEVIELKPPFTSKITRGKTHEGILTIGNSVLDEERQSFLNSLTTLLEDNEAAWNDILIYERKEVVKKVKAIFLNIFENKRDIMKKEVSIFYEKSLQELEDHLRSEIKIASQTTHANVISYLNSEIRQKLQEERKVLVDILVKKYVNEVTKIKKYYKLLLDNELYRNITLINKTLLERNDAVKAFYKQIQSENLTSTMYTMSLERKKCQINKMFLENFQGIEINEKLRLIEEKKDEIEALNKKDILLADINKQWEEKIKKVLQIFLKFISFSLKLLPEQTTFLLDIQKMVVLQLNEIQKHPNFVNTVLFDEKNQSNIIKFPAPDKGIAVCDKKPFVIVGDTTDPIPPYYGSYETLPSDIDLSYFRCDRKYYYAKCHGYESIKKIMYSQFYGINSDSAQLPPVLGQINDAALKPNHSGSKESQKTESSLEYLFLNNFKRLEECPGRDCHNYIMRNTFPYLASYVDYSEENFDRVTAILGKVPKMRDPPKLINVNNIANSELPFAATKELHHTVETQYSSQEDLGLADIECTCVTNTLPKYKESHYRLKTTSTEALNDIMGRRKLSLEQLFDENPSLLKLFTDESYDYKL